MTKRTHSVSLSRARFRTIKAAALVLLVTVAGAAASYDAASEPHPDVTQTTARKWYQVGKASWYGHKFQGQKTASGEVFDQNLLTCAHRTLPIGTVLRVTNLDNSRTVLVRVNDRGPVPSNIIVDLSSAAAHILDFSGRGMARVKLERANAAEIAELDWPTELNRLRQNDAVHPNLGRPQALIAFR